MVAWGHRLAVVSIAAGLAACDRCSAPPPPLIQTTPSAIKVRDDRGIRIELSRPARRIASLSPSNTEILFALGCGDRVVLRDRRSSYPVEARKLPATNPFQISPGHVAGFKPDLVLLSHGAGARLAALRRLGLPVAVFVPKTLDGVCANIRAVGTLCGASARAGELVADFKNRVRRAVLSVKGRSRPTVFIETDGTDPLKPWTAGAGSFVDRLVHMAGGRNIAGKLDRPYAQISAEEVLHQNPDVILLMSPTHAKVGGSPGGGLARLRGHVGWSDLPAVRQGRVIDNIDPDLLSRPGPRLVDGLEALTRALHRAEVRR